MTRQELLDTLPALAQLDSSSAHRLAEALLLEWLETLGEGEVVDAYVTLLGFCDEEVPRL
jgi:hypothetical protein